MKNIFQHIERKFNMKILMIANYIVFPSEGGNSRFTYLLDKIDCKKNKVELITSNFRHGTKTRRFLPNEYLNNIDYKVTLIDEPGYKKNVSLKRIYSHKKLAKNMFKYLRNINDKPDVIYCAIPSLDVASIALKYAQKNNIKFILDIQDLWPESFKMAINIPIICDILFYPMTKKANYIYSNANQIVAVSDTYVNRALKVNKNVNKGLSVFLGTDLSYFDKCAEENKMELKDNMIRIGYIGTLGTSYDIKSVIDAIKLLNDKGIKNIKFVVIGDGPLRNEFESYANSKNICSEFTGRLNYPEMVGYLCSCDIVVNPIIGTSVASIINKVGDYAAAGLPVINTQNSEEYRNLLDEYKAGLNCENGNIKDIADKIELLIRDVKLRKKLGKCNRKLAEEKFDRNLTYSFITDLFIEN